MAAYWMMANATERAPPPSVGFPGYIYPNDEICDRYLGIPCESNPDLCCYNSTNWCSANGENCFADNGAYPLGDKPVYADQMFNAQALTPFPNSIMWNWATIIILGFGNCMCFRNRFSCVMASTHTNKLFLLTYIILFQWEHWISKCGVWHVNRPEVPELLV